ncbi:hypothetical protein ACFL22_00875 [Patescibacteria group bacterium]
MHHIKISINGEVYGYYGDFSTAQVAGKFVSEAGYFSNSGRASCRAYLEIADGTQFTAEIVMNSKNFKPRGDMPNSNWKIA